MLGRARSGRAGSGWAGSGWAGSGWAGSGWAGSGRAGSGRPEWGCTCARLRARPPEPADRHDLDPIVGVRARAGVEHYSSQKLSFELVAQPQRRPAHGRARAELRRARTAPDRPRPRPGCRGHRGRSPPAPAQAPAPAAAWTSRPRVDPGARSPAPRVYADPQPRRAVARRSRSGPLTSLYSSRPSAIRGQNSPQSEALYFRNPRPFSSAIRGTLLPQLEAVYFRDSRFEELPSGDPRGAPPAQLPGSLGLPAIVSEKRRRRRLTRSKRACERSSLCEPGA